MTPELVEGVAWKSAAAGALALAFGGAPLGVLLIARRMSLIGDAMSHGILPGAAIAYLLAGPDPIALTLGALTAGFVVAGLSSLLAQTRRLPEDASFAVFYLSALALGVLILGRGARPEALHDMLFGAATALDAHALEKYKADIKPMIEARKLAGIHSESPVSDEQVTQSGYQCTIQGKYGWMVLQLGDKTTHTGWGDAAYQLKASGNGYAMWVNRTAPMPDPADIEDVQEDRVQSTKVLKDGQLYIRVGDKTYNVMGQIIK